MSNQCPISSQTADEKVVRQTAFLTVLLLLGGMFSSLKWIALLLCFDFFIRGFTKLPISPLRRAARAQTRLFRMKPKPINAGPKIFAAKLGFIMTVAITVLAFCNLAGPANILAQILVLLAGLEAFAGICVGCKIYSFLQQHKKSA